MAGVLLWDYHRQSHKPSINLTHPTQVQIIDALTEAIGIPHEKGQTEIPIPEKLKDFISYQFSQEYQDRVAAAKKNGINREYVHKKLQLCGKKQHRRLHIRPIPDRRLKKWCFVNSI